MAKPKAKSFVSKNNNYKLKFSVRSLLLVQHLDIVGYTVSYTARMIRCCIHDIVHWSCRGAIYNRMVNNNVITILMIGKHLHVSFMWYFQRYNIGFSRQKSVICVARLTLIYCGNRKYYHSESYTKKTFSILCIW